MQYEMDCPLCGRLSGMGEPTDYGERKSFNCDCCGRFGITGTVEAMLANASMSSLLRAAVMHRVRQASEGGRDFLLDSGTFEEWKRTLALPSPYQQIKNLVLWLGEHLPAAGTQVDLTFDAYQAVVGAADADGFTWVLQSAAAEGWIAGIESESISAPLSLLAATLTLSGWRLADELRGAKAASTTAFIAMQFGDTTGDEFYRAHLVPALAETGFELRRLDHAQPAGLIDDQLRVAIRRARFLLVDLTHGNRGAYWEAGYAEGLDKPVIYLCRKDVFGSSDYSVRPHFDTSHLVTIQWEPTKLAEAAVKVRECIRATLPYEAVLGSN